MDRPARPRPSGAEGQGFDTGPKTSALHAFDTSPSAPRAAQAAALAVHPVPGRVDLTIRVCGCPIRTGARSHPRTVESDCATSYERWWKLGDIEVPIEVTLSDRTNMALPDADRAAGDPAGLAGEPAASFCQPRLSYDVYTTSEVKLAAPHRSLRIAVLSREDNHSTRRLVTEGEERGHTVEVIDTTRCYMAINALAPEVHCGTRLPRSTRSSGASAPHHRLRHRRACRQFETLGHLLRERQHRHLRQPRQAAAHQMLAAKGTDAADRLCRPRRTPDNLDRAWSGSGPAGSSSCWNRTQGKGVGAGETKKAAQSVIDAFRGTPTPTFSRSEFSSKEAAGEDIPLPRGRWQWWWAAMKRTASGDDFRLQPAPRPAPPRRV